jgi:cytochrome c-type biogenesis protein CcmE
MDFRVTDNKQTVTVRYTGILPDLFSEGRGVVTRGRLGADNLFVAEEVLAKHDEAYMPPEVAASLQTTHAEGVAQTSAGSKP